MFYNISLVKIALMAIDLRSGKGFDVKFPLYKYITLFHDFFTKENAKGKWKFVQFI